MLIIYQQLHKLLSTGWGALIHLSELSRLTAVGVHNSTCDIQSAAALLCTCLHGCLQGWPKSRVAEHV